MPCFREQQVELYGFCKKAVSAVKKTLSKEDRETLAGIADEIIENSETDVSSVLATCVRSGTAFHHAGLTTPLRELVENGFREGRIKIISSTPTLAAGLNLPARRVIIRSYRRYSSDSGMQPIPVLEYKQMAGRAGRPRLDPYGEAVLLESLTRSLSSLFEKYIEAGAEDIWSKLGTENALRTHILYDLKRVCPDKGRTHGFPRGNIFASQYSNFGLSAVVDECLDFLRRKRMLEKTPMPLFPRFSENSYQGSHRPSLCSSYCKGLEGSRYPYRAYPSAPDMQHSGYASYVYAEPGLPGSQRLRNGSRRRVFKGSESLQYRRVRVVPW